MDQYNALIEEILFFIIVMDRVNDRIFHIGLFGEIYLEIPTALLPSIHFLKSYLQAKTG